MAELRIDPEEGVISALMVEPKAVEKICNMLSPEMFTSAVLGRIYLEYLRAYDRNTELTLAELQIVLGDEMMPYEVEDALSRCLDSRLTSADIVGSAKAILARYKKSCVDKILERTMISEGNVDEEVARLITDLESLQEGKSSSTLTVAEIAEQYKDAYFIDDEKPKANFGIKKMDDMVGGLEGGDLIIIGARPATGKSALVTQWAWHFADMGLRVGFYNLEMTSKQMYERMIASRSGISITRIRMAKAFQGDERPRYERAVRELVNQKNIFITTGAKKVSEIKAEIRHMNYDLLIVDYIQLLLCDGKYSGNRAAEVGEISRQLKDIAMSFSIPVIALSQLNRVSEGSATKEPNMGQLREAGNLEQDASIIILLWNGNESDMSEKYCKVEKSRQGTVGRCDLKFDGAHMRFYDIDSITPFDGR